MSQTGSQASVVKEDRLGSRMGTLFEDLRVVQERIASLGEILNVPTASANSDGASPAGSLGQQRINELSEAHEQLMAMTEALNGIITEVERFS